MAPALLERLAFAAVVALLTIGAIVAWTAANMVKRLAGVIVAELAALVGAAVLGVGNEAIAGAALVLASTMIGAAIIVRLQESYGGVEAVEIDRADAADEPGG
ncbi:MAG: hypothetical protein ABUL73_00350 [Alphaproteobacteria bacterium]